MLQRVRKHASGLLAKILIGAIAITFVLWGTSSLWTLFTEPEVIVSVNDESIYLVEYESAYTNAKREEERELGSLGTLGREERRDLQEKTLEELINGVLVLQAANEDKISLSPIQLDRIIVNEPTFQNQGKFNAQLYRRYLARIGTDSRAYKENILRQFKSNLYLSSLMGSNFYTPQMLQDYVQWKHQDYVYRYVLVSPGEIDVNDSPTDEDLRSFYEENIASYSLPQRLEIQYVHLTLENTLSEVIITDEDIDTLYTNKFGARLGESNVTLRHILFRATEDTNAEVEERAQSVLKTIQTLEDFSAKAQEFSEDLVTAGNGGSLGSQKVGELPNGFIEAIRSIGPNEKLVGPVRTNLGLHLLWVEAKPDIDIPTLSDLRDELAEELRYEQVEELLLANAEILSDYISQSKTLNGIEETSLAVDLHKTGTLTPDSSLLQKFGDIFFEELDLLGVGETSGVLWLDDGSFLTFELLSRSSEELRSFVDVKEEVLQDFRRFSADADTQSQLEETMRRVNSGELTIRGVLASLQTKEPWETGKSISQSSDLRDEIADRILASSVQRLPYANYTKQENGDYAFFVIENIVEKTVGDIDSVQLQALRGEYLEELSLAAREQVLEFLKSKAEINRNIVPDDVQ